MNKRLTEIQNKKSPDLNITRLSDDPRRGGRREQLETLGTLPSTSNKQGSDENKNKAPDGDNTTKPPMISPEETDTTMSNIQGKEKENRALPPRLGMTTKTAKIITKERDMKTRIPWWSQLINKERDNPDKDKGEGMNCSTPTISTHGRKLGEPNVACKQGIPNGPSPGMTTDEEEVY